MRKTKAKQALEKFQQLFNRYVQIKKTMRELEMEEEALRPFVIEYAEVLLGGEKSGTVEVEGVPVNITIGVRLTYEYPPEVVELIERCKIEKKKAEADGRAKVVGQTKYISLKF